MTPMPVVVLISGEGTNLQSIINAANDGRLPVRIRAVISNRPAVGGLKRAQRAGIDTRIIDHTRFADRAHFEAALRKAIDDYRPHLVILAGFMRVLGEDFVNHYRGRLMNIHPSLLPAFPGLDTHRRALAAGTREHGASVHFVTNEVDGGPVVVRARVPVPQDDDPRRLAARVLAREHDLYPLAIRWYAEGRLKLVDGKAQLDGKPLDTPVDYDAISGTRSQTSDFRQE